MKFQIISMQTGEQMTAPEGYEYLLHEDGSVSAVHDVTNDSFALPKGFIVEFAFSKNENGEWLYEHCVVND